MSKQDIEKEVYVFNHRTKDIYKYDRCCKGLRFAKRTV